MPRRLAVAKHAGGFDSVGWTLLGFLLGASLAVFALLHADFHGMMRPLTAATPPPPPRTAAVVSYTPPPTAAQASPPPVLIQATASPSQPSPDTALPPGVNALASAGAASAHAISTTPRAKPAPQTRTASASSKPASSASDAEVADDAAAAGMTSRAASGATPELY